MVKVGEGVVFGLTLPILFAYAVYKGTLKVCGVLVEKVKDGANFVKTVFNSKSFLFLSFSESISSCVQYASAS